MPKSYERTDWTGRTYTVHEDDQGNVIGTSEKKTDWLGREYTVHEDAKGNRIGTSEERTDIFGRNYTQHMDSKGDYTGTSENRSDIFGRNYTQHMDNKGDYTGTSEKRTDWLGRSYTTTEVTKKTESTSASSASSAGTFTGSSSSRNAASSAPSEYIPPTYRIKAGGNADYSDMRNMGIAIMFVCSILAIIFQYRHFNEVMLIANLLFGIALTPTAVIALMVKYKKKRFSSKEGLRLRRITLISSTLLLLFTQGFFLFYTSSYAANFALFLNPLIIYSICWIAKLVYSIVLGIVKAIAMKNEKVEGYDVGHIQDMHNFTAIVFLIAAYMMEFLNTLTVGTFFEIGNAIIMGPLFTAFSILIMCLLLWLSNLPCKPLK